MEPVATNNATNFVRSGNIENPEAVLTRTHDDESYLETYPELDDQPIPNIPLEERYEQLTSQLGYLYYQHLSISRKLEEIEAGMSQTIQQLDNL
jgi:hypothetical protein